MKYSGERFLPEECKGEIAIEHYQRYQLACQISKSKIVLDAACGEGYGSSLLAQCAKEVIGLDIDRTTIENAIQKYAIPNLSFVAGSIAALPFRDSFFDVVVSYETIEHVDVEIQKRFLCEIKRVLKPDGILVMSTPNKAVYTDKVSGYNQFHKKEFYVEEYLGFLHKYFDSIEIFCQFPDVGYFIAKEAEKITAIQKGCTAKDSRYVIAVCSDQQIENYLAANTFNHFDDSMYYTLYTNVHRLEKELLNTKKEADAFQGRLEENISGQKDYIEKLESTINEQKEYVSHLEKDILGQREYVSHLEKDISGQKEYVSHLEMDISNQKEYIYRLEENISKRSDYALLLEEKVAKQKEYILHLETELQKNNDALTSMNNVSKDQTDYIQRLEEDINTRKIYISHLEQDLDELTQYTRHLETDIRTLNEHVQKMGETHNV